MTTERIQVEGLFDDGNAFFILSKCARAARRSGWTDEQFKVFSKEAQGDDYDHLLRTVMTHFEEVGDDE